MTIDVRKLSEAIDLAYTLCEQLGEDAFIDDHFREQARAFLALVDPKQKGEREEALLKWAAGFVADVESRGGIPPLHVSGDAMHDICRALLSSSAAEAEMREALEHARRTLISMRTSGANVIARLDCEDAVTAIDRALKEPG